MILMPDELTAENGAKYALIGKFHETFEHECPECEGCGMGAACPHAQGESRCEHCDGAGTIFERVPVEWTTIKEIYKHAVALLGKSQDAAIAEAVAAERERCAKVCEAHSNSALCSAMIGGPDARGLQNISYAHQRAAQSIRSAAK